jgi:hypothetical protein
MGNPKRDLEGVTVGVTDRASPAGRLAVDVTPDEPWLPQPGMKRKLRQKR